MGAILGTLAIRYCVVQFLPSNEVNDYAIIPESWIVQQTNKDIVISYPDEELARTQIRVENKANRSKDWRLYRATLKGYADSYEAALQALSDLKDICAKAKTNPPSTAADDDIDKMDVCMQNIVLDERVIPRKSLSALFDESYDEFNLTPKRKIRNPYKKPADCKLDDPKNTLRYPNLVELVAESDVYIDAEELEHYKATSDDRYQLSIALMNAVFTDEALATFLLTSHDITSKLNEKATKAVMKYVTEVEGEKWSSPDLKPHKPKNHLIYHNLVRLLPICNVLVDKSELEESIAAAKYTRKTLARTLMRAVFTEEALMNCSLRGQAAVAFDLSLNDTRPGLDSEAVEVILIFTERMKWDVRGNETYQWDAWDKNSVIKAMNSELAQWRLKKN